MLRPTAVLAANLLSLVLLTACSDQAKDAPDRARPSSASTSPTAAHEPEEALEKQDKVPDEWPPEIPLPVGYKIGAVSEPTEAKIHGAQVTGLPKEAVSDTLADFESNGFTLKKEPGMNELGFFDYVNEKWDIMLTVSAMDRDGEPTTEDTGVYTMIYLVGPAE